MERGIGCRWVREGSWKGGSMAKKSKVQAPADYDRKKGLKVIMKTKQIVKEGEEVMMMMIEEP